MTLIVNYRTAGSQERSTVTGGNLEIFIAEYWPQIAFSSRRHLQAAE